MIEFRPDGEPLEVTDDYKTISERSGFRLISNGHRALTVLSGKREKKFRAIYETAQSAAVAHQAVTVVVHPSPAPKPVEPVATDIETELAKQRQATSTGGSNPQLREILPEAEGRARDKAADVDGDFATVWQNIIAAEEWQPEPNEWYSATLVESSPEKFAAIFELDGGYRVRSLLSKITQSPGGHISCLPAGTPASLMVKRYGDMFRALEVVIPGKPPADVETCVSLIGANDLVQVGVLVVATYLFAFGTRATRATCRSAMLSKSRSPNELNEPEKQPD